MLALADLPLRDQLTLARKVDCLLEPGQRVTIIEFVENPIVQGLIKRYRISPGSLLALTRKVNRFRTHARSA